MLTVRFEPSALKKLNHLDASLRQRILEKVRELESFPACRADVKKLHGADNAFRLRVGGWRIIFAVYRDINELVIFDLDTRGRIY